MNFSEYVALCGAMSPLGKIVVASDHGIAFAYLAIPVGLLIVRRNRLADIPYPWMLGLFAAFIVACGLTHLVHALQMPYTTFEHTATEAAVKAVTAILSIGTAVALIAITPRVLRMISPVERAKQLEREVARRTHENTLLLREVNHRLGNQLQIMASAVRVESRRSEDHGEREVLARIQAVIDELARDYHERKQRLWQSDERPPSDSPGVCATAGDRDDRAAEPEAGRLSGKTAA